MVVEMIDVNVVTIVINLTEVMFVTIEIIITEFETRLKEEIERVIYVIETIFITVIEMIEIIIAEIKTTTI